MSSEGQRERRRLRERNKARRQGDAIRRRDSMNVLAEISARAAARAPANTAEHDRAWLLARVVDARETLSFDEFCERFARENPPASVPPEDRLPRRALAACRNYARWAREVDRLTLEIKTVVCPEAYPSEWDNLTGGQMDSGAPACFAEARNVMVPSGPWPDDGDRPRRLDEVAAAVADCPECSRLCSLIAERRIARRKLGAAKRSVRWAGRAALDRDADRDVDPAPAWPGDLL